MSAREWKPGDVALYQFESGMPRHVALRVAGCKFSAHHVGPHWHLDHGGWAVADSPSVRPLIVIDPEDRKQVEAICWARWTSHDPLDVDKMQAALRSLITPPKPEEPTGLGAVVLDSQGVEVVHIGDGIWTRNGGPRAEYALVDAVRVLSEGVQS